MAKKPMKFKRYEGGGEVEESAAKQRGLDISNKEKPVGFFERIRMGNIDDPSSEAYKRFGAGRGRAASAAEEDRPKPVPRPPAKPNPIFAAGEEQGKRQPSGDASVAEDYSGARTKPIVTTSEKKPAASKPASKPAEAKPKMEAVSKSSYDGPLRGMRSDMRPSGADKRGETDMSNYKPRRSSGSSSTDGRGETDMSNYKPRRSSGSSSTDTRGETDMSNYKPRRSSGSSSADTRGETDMSNYKPRRSSGSSSTDTRGETDMSNYKPRRSSGSSSTDTRGETDMSNYKPRRSFDISDTLDTSETSDMSFRKGGKVKKYASGGMVSGASKRADGIATKGKTRCKIC
jgi:hypothetical protein